MIPNAHHLHEAILRGVQTDLYIGNNSSVVYHDQSSNFFLYRLLLVGRHLGKLAKYYASNLIHLVSFPDALSILASL